MPVAAAPPGEGQRLAVGRERPGARSVQTSGTAASRSISEAVMSPPQSLPPGVRPCRRLPAPTISVGRAAMPLAARRRPPRAVAPAASRVCRSACWPMTIGRRSARRWLTDRRPRRGVGMKLNPRPDAAGRREAYRVACHDRPPFPRRTQAHGAPSRQAALGPATPSLAPPKSDDPRPAMFRTACPRPGPASVSPRDAGPFLRPVDGRRRSSHVPPPRSPLIALAASRRSPPDPPVHPIVAEPRRLAPRSAPRIAPLTAGRRCGPRG